MESWIWKRPGGWIAALALSGLAVGPALAEEPQAGSGPALTPPPAAAAPQPQVELPQAEPQASEPVKLSGYWIGVTGHAPVPQPLRKSLGLKGDGGVLVGAVIPDGPAAKAGIKEHDVLVTAGGKRLDTLEDLIDAVDAAKDSKLPIDVVRGGKPMTVEVQPAPRPVELAPDLAAPGSEWDQMRKWMERFRLGEPGKPPLRFRFFHPGTILPPDASVHLALPENLSVTITKKGNEPVTVVVVQGDQRWEVTERDLNKLPDAVRPYVDRMLGLGQRPWSLDFDFVPQWEAPVQPETPAPEAEPQPEAAPPEASGGRVERRMEALERRFEQMRKSLEELRESRPRLRGPADKPKPPEQPPEAQEQI